MAKSSLSADDSRHFPTNVQNIHSISIDNRRSFFYFTIPNKQLAVRSDRRKMACANNNEVDDFVTCDVCFIEFDTENKKPKFLQ